MLKKQYLKSKPVCKVTFSLPLEAAEGASEVKVLGEFNNWSWENGAPMKAGKKDYTATLELETARSYQFRYFIDQQSWENDYEADQYVKSEFEGIDNSVVVIEAAPAPATKKAAPAKKAAKPKAKKKSTASHKTAKASATVKDDLKKIEGIGPKIASLINEAGITTFEELAKAKKATLKDILDQAGPRFKMHDPTTWTKQAKLAASGKWEQLEKLQKELKGGKRK